MHALLWFAMYNDSVISQLIHILLGIIMNEHLRIQGKFASSLFLGPHKLALSYLPFFSLFKCTIICKFVSVFWRHSAA